MSIENIIRAWKDEDFRASLTEAERKSLPENPAADTELSDADLRRIVGGTAGHKPVPAATVVCPKEYY